MSSKVLVYLLRRDIRVSDNPILHQLVSAAHDFTHLLPVCVLPAHQIEVSGFIRDGSKSPFPEARGEVSGLWRCGPYRARFIGQSVWNVKENLESLDSGLVIRVGKFTDVLENIVRGLKAKGHKVGAVWMISEEGVEEKREEKAVSSVCSHSEIDFKAWHDEKYFIDDRDLSLQSPKDLPDIFTTWRKMVEPLREKPRSVLPKPSKSSLPPLPPLSDIPEQSAPFVIPTTCDEFEDALVTPVKNFLDTSIPRPDNIETAHPFRGGETHALARLDHIIKSGAVHEYKSSRNGLLGTEFSTKLSAYLSQGCITARQIHEALVAYEDGKRDEYAGAPGYGEGENEGSKAVRFELLWRDYMRLCTKKFAHRLFRRSGFRDDNTPKWKSPKNEDGKNDYSPEPTSGNEGQSTEKKNGVKTEDANSDATQNVDSQNTMPAWYPSNDGPNTLQPVTSKETDKKSTEAETNESEKAEVAQEPVKDDAPEVVAATLKRIFEGTTGMGLIDASQRELYHTGYTSNRARQNVASFLAKHLGIDWRYGAEWYEMLLVDYDVSSNWANWQYVSGVGNDPRGGARIFNPVKQAFDYDKDGEYVRGWVPELRPLEKLENVFQAWTTPKDDWARLGLTGLPMAENPVKKIDFQVDGKPQRTKRPFDRRRKDGRIRSGTNHAMVTPQGAPQGQPQQAYTNYPNAPPRPFHPNGMPPNARGNPRGGRGGYGGPFRGRGYATRGGGGYRGGHRGGLGQQPGYPMQQQQQPPQVPWAGAGPFNPAAP